MATIRQIKNMLKPTGKFDSKDSLALSTGSTLLNIACTGHPRKGFLSGRFFYFVGDSGSGKTFLTLTCFAEACLNRMFDHYRLIFDNAEDGALMDFERFFGSKAAGRIEPPNGTDGPPAYSQTIQDFFFHLDDARREGIPFIYVLDSMDSLTSVQEKQTFGKQKSAYRKGKKMPGSYGDGKAKINSSGIRQIMGFLRDTGSILIIISQTRDNLDSFGWADQQTRAGGRALTFYTTLEMWTSQAGHILKEVNDKKRELGIFAKVHVKKNRICGKDRTVIIPIYHGTGVDDLGSCVDYLVDEGHWKKRNGRITATELEGFVGTREQLIKYIEESESERELQDVVRICWEEIESQCVLDRKRKYE